MANVIRPLAAEIASPTTAGAASNVSGAQIVRAINSAATGTQYLVTLQQADSDSTIIGSFSLAGNDTTFIKKNPTEEIFSANAAVLLSNVQCLVEKDEKGKKKYIIEGVFAQAETKNRNGRIYPKPVMEQAVAKYVDTQVSKDRAVGELNHPEGPTVNLDKVSHKINELKFEGNNVMGRASILDTPNGQIVKGLLDGGVQLGVSTRGMGSLQNQNGAMVVKDDFILNTVDIVQDPSAPTAFVNGVMEGVDWIWNNGILERKDIEKIETEIKKAPRADLYETQVREFKNFLSLMKKAI